MANYVRKGSKEDPSSIRARVLSALLQAFGRFGLVIAVIAILCVPALLVHSNSPREYDYNAMTIDYSKPFRPQDAYQPMDPGFNFTVLLDAHSHTDVGGGQMSPDTTIQWHIANGYTAFVVTDHNEIDRAFVTQQRAREKYNDSIKVLIGEEWSNCRMHMGLIGIKKYIDSPKTPTDLEIQQVINETHAQGGIVVVNHIPWSYWSGLDMPSHQDLIDWGVDFFDVTTSSSFDLQTYLYAKSKGVGTLAATDVHEITSSHEWTLLNVPADNITEDSILDALKSRKTSFFFDTIGYMAPTKQEVPPPNKMYTVAYPWILLGNAIHTFYWRNDPGTFSFVNLERCNEKGGKADWVFDKKGIISTLLWIVALWLMFEIVFGFIRFAALKLWALYQQRKQQKYKYLDDDVFLETPLKDLEWK